MASFKLTVTERETAAPESKDHVELQCVDQVGANGSGLRSSATEEEPGPLSPLGS